MDYDYAPANRVGSNLVANVAGRAWTAAIRLLCVPVYLHYLGVEAFALVGIHTTLTALLLVLDLGLSAVLTRDLARLTGAIPREQEARDLARTLEAVYWAVGGAASVITGLAAGWIANDWLNPSALAPGVVQTAILMMAVVIGLQWPWSLYTGGLLGLQRHAGLNAITAVGVTVQSVGSVLVLRYVAPTVVAFFAWQIAASAALVSALAWYFWRTLDRAHQPRRVHLPLLRDRWKFAAGMTGITLFSTVLTQADKVILSRTLPLADFGYYTFAFSVAGVLGQIAVPIYTAVYPRLIQLTARGDEGATASLYHQATQTTAALLVPAAVLLAVFPHDLLVLYSRNEELADHAWRILGLLALGIGLNAIMLLPLALQLAAGWTSLSLWKNVLATILYIPLVIALTSAYGAVGAAIAFIILNVGYILIEVPLMHRRLLPREIRSWYWCDVGRPLCATLAVAAAGGAARPYIPAKWLPVFILISGAAMLVAAVVSTPQPALVAYRQLRHSSWRRGGE